MNSTYVRRVVVIGFRPVEFRRIQNETLNLPLTLIDGGCIEDRSNAQRRAVRASEGADLIFWRPRYARKLPAAFVGSHNVRFVNGVSAAVREIQSLSRVAA